ncbi:MAG: flavodoxin domain-containing protein, partial [Pontibacterium sp.]
IDLLAAGHIAKLVTSPTLDTLTAGEVEVLLVCTATIGDGEVPDNLYPFYTLLEEAAPKMPWLKYGLIALGDSGYDEFTGAGTLMDTALQGLNAQRIGDMLRVDALEYPDPEDVVKPWLREWATKF